MQTFFHPIFDTAVITITNNQTGVQYLKVEVRGMKEGQELINVFDDFLKEHECASCAAKRILVLIDIPQELRDRITVVRQ